MARSTSTLSSVLCVIAHPDDELFNAGTLVHLAQHGVDVHLVCATRGEQGAPGYPPLDDLTELGQVRSQEMNCAAEVIGAASLEFLGYVDETGEDSVLIEFAHDPTQLREDITHAIQQTQAEVIITHGSDGEYGHPAHKLLHRAVCDAANALASPLVYSFQASFDGHPDPKNANQSDTADVVVDTACYLESHVMPMFECHRTQSSWWLHLKTQKLGRPATKAEAWHLHPRKGLCRQVPKDTSASQIDDIFTRWLAAHPSQPAQSFTPAELSA
ncbi:MAG: PIG-L deacetylase family protein [Deinococcota bacterium]